MCYEEFKEFVVEEILNYLPDSFRTWTVEEDVTYKVNQCLDTLRVVPPEELAKGGFVIPNFYLEDYYSLVEDGVPPEDVLRYMASFIMGAPTLDELGCMDFSMEEHKEHVIYFMVNKENNETFLENVPHHEMLDLAVAYRIVYFHEDDSVTGLVVTNDVMNEMGMTEEELFQLSKENMKRMMPFKLLSLYDSLKEQGYVPRGELMVQAYTLTTEQHTFGAGAIASTEILKNAASSMGGDFMILPSSTHELILVPAELNKVKFYRSIVKEANSVVITENEWLSDNVYLYSCQDEKVYIAR